MKLSLGWVCIVSASLAVTSCATISLQKRDDPAKSAIQSIKAVIESRIANLDFNEMALRQNKNATNDTDLRVGRGDAPCPPVWINLGPQETSARSLPRITLCKAVTRLGGPLTITSTFRADMLSDFLGDNKRLYLADKDHYVLAYPEGYARYLPAGRYNVAPVPGTPLFIYEKKEDWNAVWQLISANGLVLCFVGTTTGWVLSATSARSHRKAMPDMGKTTRAVCGCELLYGMIPIPPLCKSCEAKFNGGGVVYNTAADKKLMWRRLIRYLWT